jgi:hypothetical protein
MLDRRRILAGLGTTVFAGLISSEVRAAAAIKPDDASALLVIDVQNCFLPGGSLAVKDGEQVVPVINRIAKSFTNVVMTQDWHCGACLVRLGPCRQEAVRDRRSALWQAGAMARSLRAGNRWRGAVKGHCYPACRADYSQRLPQGRGQLFSLHRG